MYFATKVLLVPCAIVDDPAGDRAQSPARRRVFHTMRMRLVLRAIL